MSAHNKGTAWYATAQASRKRKQLNVTISAEAFIILRAVVAESGKTKSQVIDEAILAGPRQPK